MERNEAITCLKDILRFNSNLSPSAVTFRKLQDQTGHSLHVKGIMQQSERQMIEEIAKKHSLAVKQDSDGLTIFKPFPPPSSR
jgi:hypothetical protein